MRDIPAPNVKFNGPIRVVETGETYDNIQSLARNMGLYYPHVYAYLHGTRKKDVEGYTFEYVHKGAFVPRREKT